MSADHLGRTEKDFAIEFGEYMAHDAERFLASPDDAEIAQRLRSSIYEFRKRAMKAGIPVHDHIFQR